MSNLSEMSWYQMMGLSKIFLRNFLIGCFLLCIVTIATLATLVNKITNERLQDQKEHRIEYKRLIAECDTIKELKNSEYIKMLKEALENQREIDNQINNLKRTYFKRK